MSRDEFIKINPTRDTAVLFIHGNVETGLDIPKTYRRGLNRLKRYSNTLTVGIDDVNRSDLNEDDIAKYHPYFITNETINLINMFLQVNHDKRVIITCVAGISRSGAVGWYLDQIQGNTSKWTYEEINGLLRPKSKFLFPHKEMYLMFNELLRKKGIKLS